MYLYTRIGDALQIRDYSRHSRTIMTYLERAKDLCRLVGDGKLNEALDAHYAEDVVVIEPTGETFQGRATQRKRNEDWLASVQEFHDGGFGAVASDEEGETTMIESWFDVTFKEGGRTKLEEVGVQEWKNGRIVRERFYYNAPG